MASEKIAVITGAGSGIGQACALSLAAAGYKVYLVGRRLDKLDETQSLGKGHKNLLIPHVCDLTDDEAVAALFQHIDNKHSRLDLLFNNAGSGAKPVSPEDLPMEEWRSVIDINLTSVFNCCRHAFRLMKKQSPQGGRIINNGSVSAYAPRPYSAPYTASKHAILGLTKSLSLDGRAYNICVGQLDIGNAATQMTEKMSEGVLQANGDMAPEARIDLQNVADALVYMASMPLDTNILTMNVMANQMPFVGRG
jgi:NAD(P)-dependent dehydrogenase (short-subunit alcohol dehydrogenase family)